ncbi:MAG: InlB B-repeat-containing protein [Acholeplasmatales bacterium]|nr:InlB B-repeat-containing protein [Acholeplasmatales bacterium]
MTKKALIILLSAIGGSAVVGTTTAVVIVSVNGSKTYIAEPVEDTINYTYNGEEQTYTIVPSEFYTVSGNKETNAGSYEVVISLKDKNKYAWKNTKNSEDLKYTFTIDKKGVLEPDPGNNTFDYTGAAITYTVADNQLYQISENTQTNAGTYEALIHLVDTINYKWTTSGNSDDLRYQYTIGRKSITDIATIAAIPDQVYSGSKLTPDITVQGLNATDYDITYGDNINVGKGTVTITGKGNYKDSKSIEFNITQKKIDIPAPSNMAYTYTGSEITYNLAESSYYTITNNKKTDAGNYQVTISLTDKTNTCWSDGTTTDKTYDFVINPKEIEAPTASTATYTYTGSELTYELSESDYYTITDNKKTNVGNYQVIVSLKNKNNTKWSDGTTEDKTFEFVINQKQIEIPAPSNMAYTYSNGNEITYDMLESTDYTISNNVKTDAGNYLVTISLTDKTNTCWSDSTTTDKTYDFVINPKELDDTFISSFDDSEKTYTSEEIKPSVTLAWDTTNLVQDTDYTIAYTNNINVGQATITITGQGNYSGELTLTFDIVKANPTYTAPTPKENLRENGNQLELINPGTTNGGTLKYSLTEVGMYSTDIPTATTAGSYKVYYFVEGDSNYNTTDVEYVDVDILKPIATFNTLPEANELIYNGSAQALVTAGTTSCGSIKYSLSEDSGFTTTIPTRTNAGEYTVYFYIEPDSDHEATEVQSVVVTISEAQSSYTAEPTGATLKYNTAPQVLIGNVPIAVGGDIFYSLDENGEFTSTIPTGTNPGEYKVYYYIKSDSNHLDSEVKYVTATISKLDIADSSINISNIANQTYTGSDLTPSVTIKLGTYTLVNDTDYELSYSNNKNAGTATITIDGLGYFEGTTSTTFTIDKMEIEVPTLTSVVYNAKPQTPVISSTYYELDNSTYSQTNVSNYLVALTLTDSENTKWAGSNLATIDADWSITAGSLSDATITGLSQEYAKTGSQLDIAPIITYNGIVLDNVDFDIYITTKDDTSTQLPYVIDVGNYILFIKDGVNLEGSYQFEFFVSTNEHNISGATVTGLTNQTYTGSAIEPIPTVSFDSTTLVKDTDYTLNYSNNIDVGTATIEIVGKGNYLSSKTVTFEIVPLGIDDSNITVANVADQTYTGSELTPSITVTFNSANLVPDTDYTVSYSDNINAGTATITITGIGNFTGSRTTTFTINKKQIATPTLQSVYYDATAKTPSIAANLAYELDDPTFNRTNAGDYQVTLALKDTSNTKWLDTNDSTIDVSWTINKLNINVLTFENVESAYQETTNGQPITITPVIKLGTTVLDNSEFTIWYTDRSTPVIAKDPIEPGNYYIWFSGINFTGSTNLQFTINKNVYDINDTEIQAIADQTYTGSAITPDLVITHEARNNYVLIKGTDYTVSAVNNSNVNVGTATLTITGIGDYKLTRTVTFTIVAKDIASEDITVGDISNKTYTGSAITVLNSEIVVNQNNLLNPLINNTDYTVSYSNNVGAGTATITITGIGNYTGTRTKYFTIDPKSIATATVSEIADMKYEGTPLTPEPTVTDGTTTLVKDTDYTLSYDNNSASGTATITITGINNYGSLKEVTFRIYLYEISDADIAAIANQAFTGSAVTPALTITHSSNPLTVNTDYTVTYSNNINASNTTNNPEYAVATIKGKGDFGGETTANFTILPKDLSKQNALNNYVITINIPDYDYTGSVITPTITIIDTERNNNLLAPTDYAVQYDKTLQAVDTYTATISGTNNYTGSRQVTFDINSLDIADATVSPISNQAYTGNQITPTNFTVTHNNHTLTNGVDYTLSYSDNTDIGEATITITGCGNYTGTKDVHFNIVEVVLTFNITYDIPTELQSATNPNNTTTITSTVLKTTPLKLNDLVIAVDNGYSFEGWTLGVSNTVVNEINMSNATNNATATQTENTFDLLVVAHSSLNTYNVTYSNLHDATVSSTTTFTVESNTITLPTPTNATEATFNGWTTGSIGGTSITTIPAHSVGNIEVYANWTYNEYQITYVLDGGTNDTDNVSTLTYYDSLELKAPSKTYYEFKGWYQTYSAGVYSNQITDIENITANMTIYAKWELEEYTITYNYNIQSNLVTNKNLNPTTYYYNEGTISLVNLIAYTYRFDGFHLNSYSGTTVTTIDTTTPANIVLYAGFTPSNTTYQTYLNNEESNAPGSVTSNMSSKVVGDEVTFTATANIGYSFLGWYNSNDQFIQADPALTFTLTTDTVVYKAKYFAYTLTYRTESSTKGSVSSNVYGATAGTAIAVSANTSVTLTATTNNGYTFIGWYDTSNDSKVSSSLIYTFNMPASSIIYEARWVSVSTQSNDTTLGTVNSLNGKYVAGDNITLTATPTTGNIFNGWYVDNVLVESNATYQTTMPNVDTVFVARFITNNITPVNTLLDYTEDESVYTFTYTQINDITATATPSINGSTITYTMTSDPNYIFAGWWSTADNTRELLSESISYSFSMEAPVNEKHVYALWINPEHVSTYRNPQVDGLVITRSFGLVTDGITATATTNNQDYNWVGWYRNDSLYDSGNTTLTLTYAQTFEKLVTMTSFNGIDITYEARWNISGIVVEVSETLGNGLGTVSKTDNGDTWTITATPDAGYDFVRWEHNGVEYSTSATVNNVPTDSGTYYAYFTARNDIDYTSNVKLQNYANNNYTDTTTVVPNNTTNTKVYISAPATPEGYELANVKVNGVNASPISSGTNAGKYELTILGDGSSQIDFYFDLLTIDITYHYNNGTQSSTVTEKYNTSTSSYAIASIANVTWYSDINLTTQVTTLDINATDIDLYACYNGNNNLSTKFDLEETSQYYKVGIKDGSFTSSTDIIIPDYINDIAVKKVNIDNLYGKSYNSITMPSQLKYIEYGEYDGEIITWIVLANNGGTFELISNDLIGSKVEFDTSMTAENYEDSTIKTLVDSIVTTYGTDSISLLDEVKYSTYQAIIDANQVNDDWWLYDTDFDGAFLMVSIISSNGLNSFYGDGYFEKLGVRPLLTITL